MAEYLGFFLQTFPQYDESGDLQYLIEGGTAIKLLHPERENPSDIDILDVKGGLSKKIGPNTSWFNADTFEEWFKARNLNPTDGSKQMLVSDTQDIDFNGQKITILNPRVIAMSKRLSYRDREYRDKDLSDFKTLGFPLDEIDELKDNFINLCKSSSLA